ncbi:MAG: hypothetical protein COU27_01845 [Candidatus Levybacteria bacterium CG10_big_fil_rev_8_21_14_0_10_36_7]|nr:MAG: hypothetical protein COU27_01845 [Candidatus Levybacteria bacterium CG10_big_fil_rev_8_21_14_0_10_36_7]
MQKIMVFTSHVYKDTTKFTKEEIFKTIMLSQFSLKMFIKSTSKGDSKQALRKKHYAIYHPFKKRIPVLSCFFIAHWGNYYSEPLEQY